MSLYYGDTHIVFTNNDVREVQMAKAALFASIALLMVHIGARSVDRIVIASAFGSHISATHAMVLGLLPDCDPAQANAVTNAAGAGAYRALCDVRARRLIEGLAP